MSRILIVEDDSATALEIERALRENGHETCVANDGESGLRQALQGGFGAITLDRMLPRLDGLSLLEALRVEDTVTPVLMVSALSDVDERIAGLRAGGDDYMVKPFSSDEVAMRIEVLLRRGAAAEPMLRAGALELDLVRREARLRGEPIPLLGTEFKLLHFLMRNPGEVLSRRLIFEKVWGYYFDPGANLINVHVARLRRKLERPGLKAMITTVKGEGYRLDAVD